MERFYYQDWYLQTRGKQENHDTKKQGSYSHPGVRAWTVPKEQTTKPSTQVSDKYSLVSDTTLNIISKANQNITALLPSVSRRFKTCMMESYPFSNQGS